MRAIVLLFLFLFNFYSFAQTWQDVGGGTSNSSHGLLEYNGQLVNLGSFNNVPCDRVALWDGSNWSCLGGGVGIVARAGVVWNGNLVVVGDFWNNFQPCVGCNGIAMWDGTTWLPLDNGFNNDVLTVTVWNGDLIVGGDFTQADGVPCSRVVRWDVATSTFVSLGTQASFSNDVRCMTEFQGDLWVGGDFNNVDGCTACDGVVKWDDNTSTWTGGNSGVDLVGGVNESVRVLFVNPIDGNLYMGGEFPELIDGNVGVQDFNMSGIAMYDGSDWTSLGTGLNEYCRAITQYNGNIIAGGYFTSAGGVSANKIAKWNAGSSAWSPLGLGFDASGIDEYVKSAYVWNGILFAGGAYTQAEGNPMNYIAQWYEPITNPPTAAFTPSNTGGCEGVCIDFTDNSSNVPTQWNWTFPGASTTSSTDQHPNNICYPNNGTYTAQLIACNANGCDTTTVQITVESLPSVTVNSETICDGQSATLTAVPSPVGGDFDWSTTETSNSITVSPSTTSSYTIEYTLNGCSSNIETAVVTVNPVPSVAITGNTTICEGNAVTLTSTPSLTGGDYAWLPNGETTSAITNSPTTTTTYLLTYTLNGCSSTQESHTVQVNPTYSLNESTMVCPGTSYLFPDGNSQTITSSTSYTSVLTTINACDSVIITTVDLFPTYSNSESASVCDGSNYVYPDGFSEVITGSSSHTSNLTTVDGCDSTIITTVTGIQAINTNENFTLCEGSDHTYPDGTVSLNITANESHVSNLISAQGCDSIITTNLTIDAMPDLSTVESSNVITSNQSGALYQWLDCSNGFTPIVGETGISYAPTTNGDYAVIVDLNGCADTSECVMIVSIGVNDLEQSKIYLYPNPSQDLIYVKGIAVEKALAYSIYDMQGRVIKRGELRNASIDLTNLSAGAYSIRVKGYNSVLFVKE